jgi:CRISPR-associated helicase Cas3
LDSGKLVSVGPAYVEMTDEKVGEYQLYTHQVALSKDNSNIVVLDAPTGSGKTLAALKRVMDKSSPAIFIYPTNVLVKSQVDAIEDLLKRMNFSPNIIGQESTDSDILAKMDSTNVDVIHLTGESLEQFCEKLSRAKGTVMDSILSGTYKEGRMRILLTNPDTIYLAFINRYARSGRIFEQVGTFKTLVFDEFHLYSGPLLARIIFMLNILRGNSDSPSYDTVFLSATHGDTLELLKSTYLKLKVITTQPLPQEPPFGKQIRYETQCQINSISRVMTDESRAACAAEEIVRFFNTDFEGTIPDIKVLGIFSSVSFAIRVASKVKEILRDCGLDADSLVYQLHGFIPRQARKKIGETRNSILIGTSAIEVGIDFDVPFLVFEAHDVGSFLQRFGRGGRHSPCSAVLFVPQPLADRLSEQKEWSFPELIAHAHIALKELSSYAGFVCSRQVQKILLSMALASNRLPPNPYDKREQFDYEGAVGTFFDILEANRQVSLGKFNLGESIGQVEPDKILSKLKNYLIKVMVRYGFLRGTMNSILTCYPSQFIGTENDVYAEADLFDLFKVDGIIEKAEKHWNRIPHNIQKRYSKDDSVFIIQNLSGRGYPQVVLTGDAPVHYRTSVYKEPACHLKHADSHLSTMGHDILNKRNIAFHWKSMTRHTDFRISRLYVEDEPGGLVIGDWAFIAEYLVSCMAESDDSK